MKELIDEEQFEIKNGVLIEYHEKDGVTDVVIPEGVTKIGLAAFCNCINLKKIEIPKSVTTIDAFAFSYCKNLINIIISKNIATIGFGAFCNCINLKEIEIPKSVTEIDIDAFDGCTNIKTFNIPSYDIFNVLNDNLKALALNTIIRDKKWKQYSKEDISKFKKYIIDNKINKDEEDKNDIFKCILKNNLMDLFYYMLNNNIYTKDELIDLIKVLTDKYKDKTDITAILLEYSNKNREEKDIKFIIEDEFNLDDDKDINEEEENENKRR